MVLLLRQWIDIWAPRSDVDSIEQADILDLPPECAKERKGEREREGVEGKRKGRERRDEWRATRAACSTALVGLLFGVSA